MSDVGLVAQAIAEIAKVIGNWQVSSERRKLKSAIDAAENYIFVSERQGKYEKITDKRQKKLLLHFNKRFFAYNN